MGWGTAMLYCDYCGAEIVGAPFRRKKYAYCSRTCADEHEVETATTDEEAELEPADDDDDEDEER